MAEEIGDLRRELRQQRHEADDQAQIERREQPAAAEDRALDQALSPRSAPGWNTGVVLADAPILHRFHGGDIALSTACFPATVGLGEGARRRLCANRNTMMEK